MQFMYIYCILYMLKSNDSKVAYVNTDRQSGNLSFRLNIARGTTDPGYRVYNLSYLSS